MKARTQNRISGLLATGLFSAFFAASAALLPANSYAGETPSDQQVKTARLACPAETLDGTGDSCPGYLAHLKSARGMLARGDETGAIGELRNARQALHACLVCIEASVGGPRFASQPTSD